jgi:hypothetical protein
MVFTASLKGFTPIAAVALIAMWSVGTASAQQSVAENIRPAGQVCLAGQACEGSSTGSATSNAAAPAVTAAPRMRRNWTIRRPGRGNGKRSEWIKCHASERNVFYLQ